MRFNHWLRAFPIRLSRLHRRGHQRLAPSARPAHISHQVESLEPRLVLSATAGHDDYDLVDPAWFQSVSTDSNPDATEWIVRLTQSATAGISSVADAASVLNVGDVSFQILKGLGLPGQVLVSSTGTDAEVRAALSSNLNVALFEQDSTFGGQSLPNDPRFPELIGLNNTGQFDGTADADIDAPEAWNTVTDTSAFVIGILDTGVDYTHPDLAANIWTNPLEVPGNNQDDDLNGFIDDVHGFDFRNNDGDPRDDNGHGTHVAGIIAAVGDNSIGVTGVTWRAQIMVLKWLGENNQGRTADAIAALNYSTMMKTRFTQAQQPGSGVTGGADVRLTNNSWGTEITDPQLSANLRQAIHAQETAGMLLIAASGNGDALDHGINIDQNELYPASDPSPNVITVAATGIHDELASFSNFGVNSVDLAAPGVGILSTARGGGYESRNGTSMSTPIVTGIAALVWARLPDATASEVKQAVLRGSDHLDNLVGFIAGGRRANAAGALSVDTFSPRGTAAAVPTILTSTAFTDLTVTFSDNVAVDEATLDNADLTIIGPDGFEFAGTLTKQSVSSTPASGSTRATTTVVYRLTPPAGWDSSENGSYTIRIAPNQIADTSGNFSFVTDIGTFQVDLPVAGAFEVNSVVDSVDIAPGNGQVADTNGLKTLRAAVTEANAQAGKNEIYVAAGTYSFTLTGANEDSAATGDLDITEELLIVGAGANLTIIDAADLDRVFDVRPGVKLTLKDLTVRGGNVVGAGGGIRNQGNLTLDHVRVLNNTASTDGGGIADIGGTANDGKGTVSIDSSTIENNTATTGRGGGLFHDSRSGATIKLSTFATNAAGSSGGAAHMQRGVVTVTNSTFSGNTATTTGGGWNLAGTGSVGFRNVTITLNSATTGGGIASTSVLVPTLRNTIVAANTATTDADLNGEVESQGFNFLGLKGTAIVNSQSSSDQVGDSTPLDPLLEPLGNFGGPTKTHRPQVGSPVVDRGTLDTDLILDQRGITRPHDGDGDAERTLIADIGAAELIYYSTISGVKYHDLNSNGVQDPNEPGLAGWTMFLDTDDDGSLDANEVRVVSAADDPATPNVNEVGRYEFRDLVPGNYIVREVTMEGWVQTSPLPYPTISIADISVPEGDNSHEIAVTVTLSRAVEVPVSVEYSTENGPPGRSPATSDGDYLASSGLLTFAPGETQKTVTITVTGDLAPELNDVFRIHLSNATSADIERQTAFVTLLNDDADFVVNSMADRHDINPGDGIIDTGVAGEITLRAVLEETDAQDKQTFEETGGTNGNTRWIVLPSGHLQLTLGPLLNTNPSADLRFTGAGADQTILDGYHTSAVFVSEGRVLFQGVTITGGQAAPVTYTTITSVTKSLTLDEIAGGLTAGYVELWDTLVVGNRGTIGGVLAFGACIAINSGFTANEVVGTSAQSASAIVSSSIDLAYSAVWGNHGTVTLRDPGANVNDLNVLLLTSTFDDNAIEGRTGLYLAANASTFRLASALRLKGFDLDHSIVDAEVELDNIGLGGSYRSSGANLFTDTDNPVLQVVKKNTDIVVAEAGLEQNAFAFGLTAVIPLKRTSPAIDVGGDAADVVIDQRAIARPQNSRGDGQPALLDIGAYEIEAPSVRHSASQFVTLMPGTQITDLAFGDRVLLSEIRGQKFFDHDGDGVKDANDEGLPDWTIYLDLNDNGRLDADEPSMITDVDGNYSFSNLDPLQGYIVAEVPQAGWTQTAPHGGDGNLVPDFRTLYSGFVPKPEADVPIEAERRTFLAIKNGNLRPAGDINGDGLNDVIVVGSASATSLINVHVIYGSADRAYLAVPDLDFLPPEDGFHIVVSETHTLPTQFLAAAISFTSAFGVGDVNGDGFDDIAIAVPTAAPNGFFESGEVHILFGSPNRFPSTVDVSSLNGRNGYSIFGIAPSSSPDNFLVNPIGDINDDGLADFTFGGYEQVSAAQTRQHDYLVFGHRQTTASIDLTHSEFVAALPADIAADDRGGGQHQLDFRFGNDINGDGIDDLLVRRIEGGFGGQIDTVVVYGTREPFRFPTDVGLITPEVGIQFIVGDFSFVGDANGDGRDELSGSFLSGSGYTFFGTSNAIPAPITESNRFLYLKFSGSGGVGRSLGDVNGDRRADWATGINMTSLSADYDGSVVMTSSDFDDDLIGGFGDFFIGYEVALGDVNGDGINEFAVQPRNTQGLVVVLGASRIQPAVHALNLPPNQTVADISFGAFPQGGRIAGLAFDDLDNDGVRDTNEPLSVGVRVFLDLNENNAFDNNEPSVIAGADGSYVFDDLPTFVDAVQVSSTYRVREVRPAGVVLSGPARRAGTSDITPFATDSKLQTLTDIAVDGERGFFLTGLDGQGSGANSEEIFSLPLAGGAASYFAAGDHPQQVVAQGGYVYWSDAGLVSGRTSVYRQAVGSGERELIYSSSTAADAILAGTGLALLPPGEGASGASAELLSVDAVEGRLRRLGLLPISDATPLGAARYSGFLETARTQSVEVAGGMGYVLDAGLGTAEAPAKIQTVNLTTGATTDLLVTGTVTLPDGNEFAPRGLVVVGDMLFFTNGVTDDVDLTQRDAIYSVPITGGTPTLVAQDERFDQLGNLTYYNGSLYVIDNGRPSEGGAVVWKVELNPTVSAEPSGSNRSWTVTLSPGQSVTNLDFGNFDPNGGEGESNPVPVRGTIFNDLNGNGVLDSASGESARAGEVVFVDANKNGALDTGELTTLTDANGDYEFTELTGNVVIRHLPALGFGLTTPNEPNFPKSAELAVDGDRATTIITGDWSGDGKNDLALVVSDRNKIVLLRNAGNNQFVTGPAIDLLGAHTAVFGDMNGDNKLDLVVTTYAVISQVTVYLNNGTGTFTAKPAVSVGAFTHSLAVGDLDHDGDQDVVAVNETVAGGTLGKSAGEVVILQNNGSGVLSKVKTVTTPIDPVAVVVAELNGDNFPDIATANFGADSVSVFLNSGSWSGGNFGFSTSTNVAVGDGPLEIVAGKFNGASDTSTDLAVTNFNAGTVSVLLNNGLGGFSTNSQTVVRTGGTPSGLASGDLDGKNGDDLVVGEGKNGIVLALFNSGSGAGQFENPVGFGFANLSGLFQNPHNLVPVAIANLNDQPGLDLVSLNREEHKLRIHSNTPGDGSYSLRLAENIPSDGYDFGVRQVSAAAFSAPSGTLTLSLNGSSGVSVSASSGRVIVRRDGEVDPNHSELASEIQSIVVIGGDGDNLIDLSGVSAGSGFTFAGGISVSIDAGAGHDTILGSGFADFIQPGSGDDSVVGNGENDLVTASSGANFTLTDNLLTGLGRDVLESIEQVQLTGDSNANTFDVTGFTGDVSLIGSDGDDIFVISNFSKATVTGGIGFDTLTLRASALDLTAIADSRLTGLERIDLTGGGAQSLTLNLAEVLAFSDTTNTLIVDRDLEDENVAIGAGWSLPTIEVIGANKYSVYAQSGATLKVQTYNTAPISTATISTQDAPAGLDFVLQLAANQFQDGDAGDVLTLSASKANGTLLPSWLNFDASAGRFSGRPATSDVGTFDVRVTATDGVGQSVSTTFSINVIQLLDVVYSMLPVTSTNVLTASVSSGRLNVTGTGLKVFVNGVEAAAPDQSSLDRVRSITINGGAGADKLNLSGLSADIYKRLVRISLNGGAGNDVLTGSEFSETISGGLGTDVLSGGGGTGVDQLFEAVASSSTTAMTISMTVIAGVPNKFTFKGFGGASDTIDGFEEMSLAAGAGADSINVSPFAGNVSLFGAGGKDILVSGGGNDRLDGGDGDDKLTGNLGNDALIGGAGIDTLIGSGGTNYVLTNSLLTGEGNDSVSGIEAASLTARATGTQSAQIDLSGFDGVGVNSLTGGNGNDVIIGGSGRDSIKGGAGNDVLTGGLGNDTFDGGTGTDVLAEIVTDNRNVDLKLTNAALTIVLSTVNLSTDSLNGSSVETARLTGGTGNNQINASAFTLGAVTLDGGGGNDVLIGGSKNDSIFGGDGLDLLIGGLGIDSLEGNAGQDILIGGTISSSINTTAALNAIMAEWTNSGRSYDDRIVKLMSGGGLNGTTKLNSSSVQNDSGAADRLNGNADTDWFFKSTGDVGEVLDSIAGETKTPI